MKEERRKSGMDFSEILEPKREGDLVIALAGNPNVGKSTVFNALTGMHQHTGNWPGKTVGCARGRFEYKGAGFLLVDIPGTYSLMAHSAEEEIARDFILFGQPDITVVVCDATCLERNLNLVLQILEITDDVIVCVNLLDEARSKGMRVDIAALEKALGVPIVGMSARGGEGLGELKEALLAHEFETMGKKSFKPQYPPQLSFAIGLVRKALPRLERLKSDWVALKLLEGDEGLLANMEGFEGKALLEGGQASLVRDARAGLSPGQIKDMAVEGLYAAAEKIAGACVIMERADYDRAQLKIDRFLTGRKTGAPVMVLLLMLVLWITITGANYPSQLLSNALFSVQDKLSALLLSIGAPAFINGLFVEGMYRVLAWVVSVMLPPMAIFFPLFTLLEDVGYLPRIAFNLDGVFKRCNACGKQALTMCMGFGCNAAGVIGCRIIDSPRERMIAILTNAFVPCNGRFPTLISIITMFFVMGGGAVMGSLTSALMLTALIVLGVLLTFGMSKLLSRTVLKGLPSSFTLEMPPFRRPQIGKVIVRSVFDRSLFVLGRAVAVAAPAGLIIWLLANVQMDGISLLAHLSAFLDPFGRLLGLDGVVLMAFILGFPANEIVIPLILMAYLSAGTIMDLSSAGALKAVLVSNGWTMQTAVCTMLFMLFHWPCSTTMLSIYKETRSVKWTALAFALPTATGMVLCMIVAATFALFGL